MSEPHSARPAGERADKRNLLQKIAHLLHPGPDSRDDLIDSLLNLRAYVATRPKLWYTVINDSAITREWAEHAVQGLRFN